MKKLCLALLVALIPTLAFAADTKVKLTDVYPDPVDARSEATNGDLRPVVVIGDDSTNNNVANVDSLGAVASAPQQKTVLDNMDVVTGWAVLGNDTTNLATLAKHAEGTASNEFDKADGAANTTVAGIAKTLSSVDLSGYDCDADLRFILYVSATTDIASCFVRLGDSATAYSEWQVADSALAAGWNIETVKLCEPTYGSQGTTGADLSDVDYIAVGCNFDAQDDTLADIAFDEIAVVTDYGE